MKEQTLNNLRFYHLALCLTMAIGASAQAQTIPPNVRVVDHQATGMPEDGQTWDTAFRDLQDALVVMDPPNGVDEIWVAQGTYLPDGTDPLERSLSFELAISVKMFGGFAGGETLLGQRDLKTNVTIRYGALETALERSMPGRGSPTGIS